METNTPLWDAYQATVGRLPDLDALRWRDADGWSCVTWRGLSAAVAGRGRPDLDGVVFYLGALAGAAPAARLAAGTVSQQRAFDEALTTGMRLRVGPRDRVLALASPWSGPWLRALWLGLVHGCAVHFGGRPVLDEVRPTVVINEEEDVKCAATA